jgi:hypothetical protein
MSKRHRLLWAGVVLALLATVAAVSMVTASTGGGPTIGKIPTAHQPGSPAIVLTKPGSVPAYTAQDVTDFVNTHGTLWTEPRQVTVTAVQFTTQSQAIAQSHGSAVDSDSNREVCLVTVRGAFTIYGPPSGLTGGQPSGSHTYSGAYLMFDAVTGNMLQEVAFD